MVTKSFATLIISEQYIQYNVYHKYNRFVRTQTSTVRLFSFSFGTIDNLKDLTTIIYKIQCNLGQT